MQRCRQCLSGACLQVRDKPVLLAWMGSPRCSACHSHLLSLPHAVGFISRPVGAVMFGHLGDTKGRGYCLLVSVLLMGIPTVLIGCLPSYKQIGIAAPILLALLRLAQGLAMGGEFGACMRACPCRWQLLLGGAACISVGARMCSAAAPFQRHPC